PSRHPGPLVRRQDERRSATSPQRAERRDGLRGIDHGPQRRARPGHEQQQQGRRPRLRAPRSPDPRQPAPPGTMMARTGGEKALTALLVIDPYNDFISEGGKLWNRISAVAEANGCVSHMVQVLNAARAAKLRIFYALHHRYRPGDYETWRYIAPIQKSAWQNRTFEYGTWGGEIRSELVPMPGEIVAAEHWCSSGFANTDLDLQLKKAGIHR